MPLSISVEGEYSLGDNGDAASLWEVRMVLGVVASGFFHALFPFRHGYFSHTLFVV
jgi:hypothetical protein